MTHEERKALGARIRQYRSLRCLTQAQLAQAAGTTRKTINLIENGNQQPNLDILLGICRALEITSDEWLDQSRQPRLVVSS
jgi:putative transcriptional regulator